MLPNLKRRRTEHTQFKNESKTKQNSNSKTIRIIHIQGRKTYLRKKNLSKEEKL